MERVAVAVLGYVGLPLACILAESGFKTVGVDIDQQRVGLIMEGRSPIVGEEPGLSALLSKVVSSRSLEATVDTKAYSNADAIFVCVDTPIGPDRKPRLEILRSAVTSVGCS